MIGIPGDPGSYCLLLTVAQASELAAGGLGVVVFPAGNYAYTGSAFGPGGLAARVGRHLRRSRVGDGRPHWHIDYLFTTAHITGVSWSTGEHAECRWAQGLLAAGGKVVAPGFGASDCRSGCAAHLVYFAGEQPVWMPGTSRVIF